MKKLLYFSFLALFLTNCDDSVTLDPIAIDCSEVACTEQFVTLIVTVQDADGARVPLDRFEVIDQKTSDNHTPNISFDAFQMARRTGQYPLYDDSFVSGNQNSKRTLVFNGFINDEKVAKAEFVIDTDCCHVSVAIGDTIISIN